MGVFRSNEAVPLDFREVPGGLNVIVIELDVVGSSQFRGLGVLALGEPSNNVRFRQKV